MEPITLLIAVAAAGAVLLIVFALSSGGTVDPVQARLTQLGTMEAKNLEELELQAPFVERTLRPLGTALSARLARSTNQSMSERVEKRLALAGNPGDIRVPDWLAVKAVGAVVGAIVFFLLFVLLGFGGVAFPINLLLIAVGGYLGYVLPEFWLGGRVKKRQKAILLMVPDTLDLLTISVRAGLGRAPRSAR